MSNLKNLITYSFMFIAISAQICGSEKRAKQFKKNRDQIAHQSQLTQNLLVGAYFNDLPKVRTALESGANINSQWDDDGNSALHIAMLNQRYRPTDGSISTMITLLRAHNIDDTLKNKKGHTVYELTDFDDWLHNYYRNGD